MPGLMATRAEYGESELFKYARIAGSLHMKIHTVVLIETLQALGAYVRWASRNIYLDARPRRRSHCRSLAARRFLPSRVRASKSTGSSTHRLFEWSDGGQPNMILDDGGDATPLIDPSAFAPNRQDAAFLETATNEEEEVLYAAIKEAAQRQSRLLRPQRGRDQGRYRRDDDGRSPPLHHAEGGPPALGRPSYSMVIPSPNPSSTIFTGRRRVARRRHQAPQRRDDGRQGRDGRGIWRRRKGIGRVASQCRLPRCLFPRSIRFARSRRRWKAMKSRRWTKPAIRAGHLRDRDRKRRRHHGGPHVRRRRTARLSVISATSIPRFKSVG